MNLKTIRESSDVSVYSKLITVLGEYVDKAPLTGMSKLLNQALENGKAILPKDKRALDILKHVLNKTPLEAIQKLLNCKFSNLPAELKPRYRDDSGMSIAFWNTGSTINDTIVSLIDFSKTGSKAGWCDTTGTKVTLIS